MQEIKLYVLQVTLPVQANIKLLRYLKTGFQRPIDWNRCCLLMNMQGKNQNQNYLN